MGRDTEDTVPGATTVLITASIFSISGRGGTQGHGGGLRMEGRQDTYGAQLLEFMCAVMGFLPVWTELWRSVFPVA